MKKAELGFSGIAYLFVGAIMGAGFASGREIWQFFGVFGEAGFIGLALVALMFIAIGFMTSRVARALNTNDLGRIVVPGENRLLKGFVANFMALLLFLAIVTMSSAGGALFYQQFGLNRAIGGAAIVILVIITVIGGFERVSGVFRFVMPVLMTIVFFTSVAVIAKSGGQLNTAGTFRPSPLAGNWPLAAILFTSYNAFGIIPIVSTASLHVKSGKHADIGACLGGLILGVLAITLLYAVMTDRDLSDRMDMPLLAFSGGLSPALNLIYISALFFAVYSSATSNFYGFTGRILREPHRKLKIIVSACIGFAIGLVGFTRIVAYMFPVEGFVGIGIILMMTINYIKITVKGKADYGD